MTQRSNIFWRPKTDAHDICAIQFTGGNGDEVIAFINSFSKYEMWEEKDDEPENSSCFVAHNEDESDTVPGAPYSELMIVVIKNHYLIASEDGLCTINEEMFDKMFEPDR